MSNSRKKLCLSYLFYLLSFFVLYFAKIQNMSSPFFYSFLFTLIYFNVNILFLSIVYFCISIMVNFSMYTMIISFLVVMFILFVVILHKIIKKPINKITISIYYILVQIFLLYKNFCIENIIIALLGYFCLICFMNYFKAYFKNGNLIHFTIDQNICGSIYLIAISLGLSQLPMAEDFVIKFIGTFLVLVYTYTYNQPISVVIGVLLGIGYCLYLDSTYLFYFSIIAIFCYGFKGYNKIISCLSVIVGELILGLYFNIYGFYEYIYLLPPILACLLFLLFSNKFTYFTKHLFGVNLTSYGIKTLVNRNREQICYKMNELSQVFNEMNRLYSSMINGKIKNDEVSHIIIDNTIKNLCSNCNYRHKCHSMSEKDKTIEDFKLVIKKGFEKGKVNILDIPTTLGYKCGKLNQLMSLINNLVVNYRQYSQMIKNADMSKLLVAEQLRGVSSLLDMLSMEIGTTILFNNKLEQKIKEELAYFDILCEEVLCYDINESSTISIVVNNTQVIETAMVENLISKIMKQSYSTTMEQIGYYGNIYEFKPSPKFGYLFGASGKGREKVSGDTFSFTKINKNKVMFAICDGMGTGENAQSISETSLNLIENFYKAGYDSQIILSSVNKLLTTGNEENYSALDIVVLDLSKGYANFIKLGAPDGIIKTIDGMEKIKAGALPLGILEEIEPMILERNLKSNDMICLFSDGIVDAFGSIEALIEFIDYQTTTNPQILADEILNKSLFYNNCLDDKTVICVRVFLNY